jgi:hypothetical protein
MEGIDRETRPAGREVEVFVFGNTADELELAALDEARPFFGAQVRLAIVPDYRAMTVLVGGSLAAKAAGRKYQATVIVRTVEGGSDPQ